MFRLRKQACEEPARGLGTESQGHSVFFGGLHIALGFFIGGGYKFRILKATELSHAIFYLLRLFRTVILKVHIQNIFCEYRQTKRKSRWVLRLL